MVLSKGCRQCHEGAKMVLFITGFCEKDCWYCPISSERKNKDDTYANDRTVEKPEDVLKEAHMMDALGTGITGGEALLETDRVIFYAGLLKSEFGNEHHIHLYTGTSPSKEILSRLKDLVDEIRFHPPHEVWKYIMDTDYIRAIKDAKELGMEVTIEVPSLPGLKGLIPALPLVDYLNINELEWSETNAAAMREKGLSLEDDYHNAVPGTREWADELLSADEKVHWCSSTFKDSVQLRERLKRIAKNTVRPFEEITDDGTIVYGLWIPSGPVTEDLDDEHCEKYEDTIELAWWLLTEYPEDFPGEKKIIERYPNKGMIVEVTPL